MLAFAPDTMLDLDVVEESVQPDHAFHQTVSTLMAQAEHMHPPIIAAEKELQAAESDVAQAKAQGRATSSWWGNTIGSW